MKRFISYICFVVVAVSCKPEVYTGPLDSPVGNWRGTWSEYFFNSEMVGDLANASEYSAISFYEDSLCCIEGVKGAFHYKYSGDSLTIDSTSVWVVEELYGNRMTLRHLEELEPVKYKKLPFISVPLEYRSMTIDTCANGYFYLNEESDTVQCRPITHMEPDSTYTIDFWFDSRRDAFESF